MRMMYRASLPCMHHTTARQRGPRLACRLHDSLQSPHAVLSERSASYDIRASEVQKWISKQRSALPTLGSELAKTRDGPSAEDLEVIYSFTERNL